MSVGGIVSGEDVRVEYVQGEMSSTHRNGPRFMPNLLLLKGERGMRGERRRGEGKGERNFGIAPPMN